MNKTFIAAALAAFASSSALACASCGCSINTDWDAQGVSSAAGLALDARIDWLDQNRLWMGTHSIAPTRAAGLTNTQTGDPAEVELYTKNRYLTLTADYNDGKTWGVSVAVPVIDRRHATLGTGSDGVDFDPDNGAYTSSGTGLGDVRVVGRYFGFRDAHDLGVQFGLKLPTGSKNQLGNDGVSIVDPGLQRGTGTTDLILGVYGFGAFEGHEDWGYFGQATVQAALEHSTMAGGTYKPGDNLSLSVGARYVGIEGFVPSAQLNLRIAKRDSGSAADTFATGGTLVYLTLGGMVPVTGGLSTYANVQVPVYQRVNGVQLTPRSIFSLGARYAF